MPFISKIIFARINPIIWYFIERLYIASILIQTATAVYKILK
jgi:hypothetical protein